MIFVNSAAMVKEIVDLIYENLAKNVAPYHKVWISTIRRSPLLTNFLGTTLCRSAIRPFRISIR